jgi:hypothetical protein
MKNLTEAHKFVHARVIVTKSIDKTQKAGKLNIVNTYELYIKEGATAMSVVIIGGHDRMARQYKDICKEYGCSAKVYTQSKSHLDWLIGNPDLIVLFTNPVSHKLARIAKKTAAGSDIALIQSHRGSSNALRNILRENIG